MSLLWTGERDRGLCDRQGFWELSVGERECLWEEWRREGECSLLESLLWLRSLPSRWRVPPLLSRPDSSLRPLSTGKRALEWPPGCRWRAVERMVLRRKRLLVLLMGHFNLKQITHLAYVIIFTRNTTQLPLIPLDVNQGKAINNRLLEISMITEWIKWHLPYNNQVNNQQHFSSVTQWHYLSASNGYFGIIRGHWAP